MIKDESRVDELLQILDTLARAKIEIGIIGEDRHNDKSDITVLAIARIHEFGVTVTDKNGRNMNIPQRSFIRGTVDNRQPDINEQVEKILVQIVERDIPVMAGLEALGLMLEGITKDYLTDLKIPELKAETIRRKGSSNPLIDSGKLRDSITHRVVV